MMSLPPTASTTANSSVANSAASSPALVASGGATTVASEIASELMASSISEDSMQDFAMEQEELLQWMEEWKKLAPGMRQHRAARKKQRMIFDCIRMEKNDRLMEGPTFFSPTSATATPAVLPFTLPDLTSPSGGNGSSTEIADFVDFDRVTIVSPEGKIIVRDLTFHIPKGASLFITGPNASGKSSIFRVLSDLWPIYSGNLSKPSMIDMVYVPQKPYLVVGTLRDQIIYPDTHDEMKKLKVTDRDLSHLMEIVDPANIITSSWSFDEVKDWLITFSGGQKQRVSLARVMYHRPQIALLDECTSAVSSDVEGKMYEACKNLGINLFTISHRIHLRKYHDYQLTLDGEGGWKFDKITKEFE